MLETHTIGVMSCPAVAIAPGQAPDWARRAVEDGGGRVVALDGADAVVWLDPIAVEELETLLRSLPSVRWVQLPWAGVEEFAARGMFEDGRSWTSGKGVYAEAVAEHALALALAGLRGIAARVRATSWEEAYGRTLYEGRVTILGGGGVAQSLLALLTPLRVSATVVRRHPQAMAGASAVVGTTQLHDALVGADLVVLALALTPETVGIFGGAELRAMEEHAWLVNVARGRHVRTNELVMALRERWIGGAALDVTDPEPLPDDHQLWHLQNCIITPHAANSPEIAAPVLAARIRANVARFAKHEQLLGVVDSELGY